VSLHNDEKESWPSLSGTKVDLREILVIFLTSIFMKNTSTLCLDSFILWIKKTKTKMDICQM